MEFGLKLNDVWCERYNCSVTFDYLKDTKPLFKIRDNSLNKNGKNDRDFCVYFVIDGSGRLVYIGQGRYWDFKIYGWKLFFESRPFLHCDFLSNQIQPDWKIAIIHTGLTSLEAKLLEALYIFNAISSGRTLTKTKAEKWDTVSLINKKREMVSNFYDVTRIYLYKSVWKSVQISY